MPFAKFAYALLTSSTLQSSSCGTTFIEQAVICFLARLDNRAKNTCVAYTWYLPLGHGPVMNRKLRSRYLGRGHNVSDDRSTIGFGVFAALCVGQRLTGSNLQKWHRLLINRSARPQDIRIRSSAQLLDPRRSKEVDLPTIRVLYRRYP